MHQIEFYTFPTNNVAELHWLPLIGVSAIKIKINELTQIKHIIHIEHAPPQLDCLPGNNKLQALLQASFIQSCMFNGQRSARNLQSLMHTINSLHSNSEKVRNVKEGDSFIVNQDV